MLLRTYYMHSENNKCITEISLKLIASLRNNENNKRKLKKFVTENFINKGIIQSILLFRFLLSLVLCRLIFIFHYRFTAVSHRSDKYLHKWDDKYAYIIIITLELTLTTAKFKFFYVIKICYYIFGILFF